MKKTLTVGIACIGLGLVSASLSPVRSFELAESAQEHIRNARVFGDPLQWVGVQPPAEEESAALWAVLRTKNSASGQPLLAAAEVFLETYPSSGWNASLRANLGAAYVRVGRYTRALAHFSNAWSLVKHEESGPGKHIGDHLLVNYLTLLSSLGRAEAMESVFSETGAREFERVDWQRKFNSLRGNLQLLKHQPSISYRCGTFALFAVASTLKGQKDPYMNLRETPSPPTGFSMAELIDLATQQGIGLIPVRRRSDGEELIVPSVLHLKQNHYAAIVASQGERYKVVDPTFGATRWLDRQAVNEEASGNFLVPAHLTPSDWELLAPDVAAKIYGKGLNTLNPLPEWPPCPDEGQDECECNDPPPSPSPSSSPPPQGGPTPSCTSCGAPAGKGPQGAGLPTWHVSEPFISLWLSDTPMLYNNSDGAAVRLRLTYNTYETRTEDGSYTNATNLGLNWNLNWLSYLDLTDDRYEPGGSVDLLFTNYLASVYGAAGGERQYHWKDDFYEPYDYGSFTTLERITNAGALTEVRIHYPNGSRWDYGLLTPHPMSLETRRLYLTRQLDPYGRTNQLHYLTNDWRIYLTAFVDLDGRTNSLHYNTNAAVPTRVVAVTNAFSQGVALRYDANGLLTNLTDVIGITTSFGYGSFSNIYYLTNMTTPYGITTFEYINPGGNLYGLNAAYTNINRAIRVTEPNSAQHVFLYRDWTTGIPPAPGVPECFSDPPALDICTCNITGGGRDVLNAHLFTRNSFYWGPRQLMPGVISTNDIIQFNNDDYTLARRTKWINDNNGLNPDDIHTRVTPTITLRVDPSPDGVTLGQKVWYGYGPSSSCVERGNIIKPTYTSWVVPNGETAYVHRRYNALGKITNEISSCTLGGSVAVRTNRTYLYAPNGIDLVAIYNAANQRLATNMYDSLHRVTNSMNAAGDVTSYTYDSDGRLARVLLPTGLTVSNLYFASGTHKGYLEKRIEVEIGRTNTFAYSNGWISAHTDERGMTRTFQRDALGRILQIGFPDGTTFTNGYTFLDLTIEKDRLGNLTRSTYNSARQLTQVVNARDKTNSYQYCECGSLNSATDAENKTTSFFYDLAGRRIATIYPDASWVTNHYNLLGQLTNIVDSAGTSVTNHYNNQGFLVLSSNRFGQMFRATYDIHDELVEFTDANGTTVTNSYDALHRLVSRRPQGGAPEYFAHWARGMWRYTDPLGNITRFGHDAARRKTSETNANLSVTWFGYNPAGDLVSLTDPTNHVTRWAYDPYGRVTHKTNHLGVVELVYQYDAEGRLTNRWSLGKTNTTYSYDPVGNLTNVNYHTDADLTLQYDAVNRLTNLVDALGVTRYTYDSLGRPLSEDGPWPDDTVSVSYGNQLRSSLGVPQPGSSAWSMAYGYDAAKRLKTLDVGGLHFTNSYHPGLGGHSTASRLVEKISWPGGATITKAYDIMGRLSSSMLETNGVALDLHSYQYDNAHRRTRHSRTNMYVDHAYDGAGQLVSSKGYDSALARSVMHQQFGYQYDPAGNLRSRTNNALVQTFSVNALNQLTNVTRSGTLTVAGMFLGPVTNVHVITNIQGDVFEDGPAAEIYSDNTFACTNFTLVDGTNSFKAGAIDTLVRVVYDTNRAYLPATVNFTYDLNGNLLSDGVRHFSWDDENQLVQLVVTNSTKSEFTYDGRMRRRVRKESVWQNGAWQQTTEVRYIYDGNIVLQERHYDPRFSLSRAQRVVTYTRGLDLSATLQGAGGIGGLLARTEVVPATMSSATAYYHADGNGNITALVDTNQIVVARYVYDPFGGLLAKSGPLADANLYRFSSKEWHEPSGLVYYLYRYYDPSLQRWPNRDPLEHAEIRQGTHLYSFVKNQPISRLDRDGREVGYVYEAPQPGSATGRMHPPQRDLSTPIDPSALDAWAWMKKCHPELAPRFVLWSPTLLPFLGNDGFAIPYSSIWGGTMFVAPAPGTDDYVDTIAHEGMHAVVGPTWGESHEGIRQAALEITREYFADPTGKNCKCNGNHPGAAPASH